MAGVYLMPVLVLPLFNNFEPLPEGELREVTVEIGRKAGIENLEEIYVMDASRQTKKRKRLFYGYGKNNKNSSL